MLIKSLKDCPEIIANDGCRLRELLHPAHDPAAISYSLAMAWVDPHGVTHPHVLAQTEVYFLIRGRGRMHIGDEVRDVTAGDALVIPPGKPQWIENPHDEVLEFAAIVSPPWQAVDDQRV